MSEEAVLPQQPGEPGEPGPSGSTGPGEPYRWRWLGLVVVLLAAVMDFVDATMTAVAAPSIRLSLGGDNAMMQWLAAAYTLAFACTLITGGRLGDFVGRKRMLMIGTAGFAASSVLCGLAAGPEMIVISRAMQGLFAGLMIPQALGLLKQMFSAKELPAAFGAYGATIGLASVAGPIIAGGLISADWFGSGWRMIFLVNVPVAVLVLVGATRYVPEVRAERAQRLDLVGTVLVTAALALLMYPLVQGHELGWPTWTFLMMLAAAPVMAAFVWYELRRERTDRDPLIVSDVFHNRAFTGGLVLGLVIFCALTGLMLVIGMFVQLGLGYSPLKAGFTLVPLAVGSMVGAAVGSSLVGKVGRTVLQAGLVIVVVGVLGLLLTLRLAGTGVTPWLAAPALLVTGTGMGMAFSPFFDIVLGGVEDHQVGSASGTLSATQQIGNTTGAALLGTIFFAVAGAVTADRLLASMNVVLGVDVVLLACAIGLSFLLPRRARQEVPEPA